MRALCADKHLYHMPTRRTDRSNVLVKSEATYKLNVAAARPVVYLKRCVCTSVHFYFLFICARVCAHARAHARPPRADAHVLL
jgi:hypothetical protein